MSAREELIVVSPPPDILPRHPRYPLEVGDLILVRYEEYLEEADRLLLEPELLIVLEVLFSDGSPWPAWRNIKVARWSDGSNDNQSANVRRLAYESSQTHHRLEDFMQAFWDLTNDMLETTGFGARGEVWTLDECAGPGTQVYLHTVPAAVRNIVLAEAREYRTMPLHAFCQDGYFQDVNVFHQRWPQICASMEDRDRITVDWTISRGKMYCPDCHVVENVQEALRVAFGEDENEMSEEDITQRQRDFISRMTMIRRQLGYSLRVPWAIVTADLLTRSPPDNEMWRALALFHTSSEAASSQTSVTETRSPVISRHPPDERYIAERQEDQDDHVLPVWPAGLRAGLPGLFLTRAMDRSSSFTPPTRGFSPSFSLLTQEDDHQDEPDDPGETFTLRRPGTPFPFNIVDGPVSHVAPSNDLHRSPTPERSDPFQCKTRDWFAQEKSKVLNCLHRVLEDICGICLCDFEANENIACLPCYHFFHKECVAQSINAGGLCCPACRARLSDDILDHARLKRVKR